MFDFGFGEIVLVLMVALVVLGPERLPKAARTVGAWIGKVRYFVANAKSEISQQLNDSDLQSLQQTATAFRQEVSNSMQSLQNSVSTALDNLPEPKTPDDFLPKYTAPEKSLKQKSRQTQRQNRPKNRVQPHLRGSRRNSA